MHENALTARFEKTPLETVELLVREHFGISGSAAILNSERDETFLLTAAADNARYVVKLASPLERRDILTFQTEALLHLAAKSIAVPLPVPVASLDGPHLVPLAIGGENRILRLLTYLDGVLLYRTEGSAAQAAALGTALARLGAGLADFHPQVPEQTLLWDLCRTDHLRPLVPHVAEERRGMVTDILDAIALLDEGPLRHVRRQVIHNDFNPHNLLVDSEDWTRVTGVIDFGDMVEAPLVNDIAVALSYQVAPGEWLERMLALFVAFDRERPLEPIEIDCLPALIRGRLGMSITIAEWRAALYPENSAYILRNHGLAQHGLAKLASLSDRDLSALFRQTLGDRR